MSAPALRPYQEVGRNFLATRHRALLADEMRVGKTPQAILAAAMVGGSSLVVCPAIAVPQWKREWRRWAPDAWEPTVVSYDYARNRLDDLRLDRWDNLIVDECHFAKNPDAGRTRAIYARDGLGHKVDRIWALSGTPCPNHAGELWPMLRAFGVTKMLYVDFVRYFCYTDETGRPLGTKRNHIPELCELLDRIMLRRTRKEVAPDMPELQFNLMPVTPDWSTVQVPGWPSLPDCFENGTDDDRYRWLQHHVESLAQVRVACAASKVLPLAEHILNSLDSGAYTQTVVFGVHRQGLRQLQREIELTLGLHSAEIIDGDTSPKNRERIQDSFRAGTTKVLVANVLAAGTAIDLSAAQHGYFLELDFVPANNAQAANRIMSMQEKLPRTFDVCYAPGSVDEAIQRTLARKTSELRELY